MSRTSRSRQYSRTREKTSLWRILYSKFVFACKRRNLVNELDLDAFKAISMGKCYLCGAPPSNKHKTPYSKKPLTYSGIDRIDNNKGYTLDNCRPCCKKCNMMKASQTLKGFTKQIKKIVNYYRPIRFVPTRPKAKS